MKQLLIILFTIATLSACKKSDLMTYAGENDIYFLIGPSTSGSADSLKVTFPQWTPVQSITAGFVVRSLGKTQPQRRPYVLKVNETLSTAVAGKHYELPGSDSFYMEAGAMEDSVVVKILHPADLQDKSVVLYLTLVPNEYFNTDMPQYNDMYNARQIRIVINDILLQPNNWAASQAFLGAFSRAKITLLMQQQSLLVSGFYPATGQVAYGSVELSNFARQFQVYLSTQAAAGNIIKEKDGSTMVMGPSAQ